MEPGSGPSKENNKIDKHRDRLVNERDREREEERRKDGRYNFPVSGLRRGHHYGPHSY